MRARPLAEPCCVAPPQALTVEMPVIRYLRADPDVRC